jgi:hypothetical protein
LLFDKKVKAIIEVYTGRCLFAIAHNSKSMEAADGPVIFERRSRLAFQQLLEIGFVDDD